MLLTLSISANHLNATEERKVLVKFYFYHDTSYVLLLWMLASTKSFSKVEEETNKIRKHQSKKTMKRLWDKLCNFTKKM